MHHVELTDAEAHLISEIFEATAYPGPLQAAIRRVADSCGTLSDVGIAGYENLLESIFDKTKS